MTHVTDTTEAAVTDTTEAAYLARTRTSYDAIADVVHEEWRDALDSCPLSRAMLTAFAELVKGEVVDVGCGTGKVSAYLDGLGVATRGIDLSPGMLALARATYPHLRFDEGSMTALDLPDGAAGGVVAWYSTIHVPPRELPGVFAEFHRVLAPGAPLLLGFQVGDEPRHYDEAFGHAVDLDFHRWRPERIADQLREAGLVPTGQLVREPYEGERTPQAYVLAAREPYIHTPVRKE
ncbi:methyltransferase domain-containing protein [Streptomyces sp. NPDC047071]|uniref:class I SAM-dependent DNA methyltransferase n=1 Tax=Streptomyces sp. NPDC047071 TaxID=3154808 RepID=UPI003453A4C5